MSQRRRLIRTLVAEALGLLVIAAFFGIVWYRQASHADIPPALTAAARATVATLPAAAENTPAAAIRNTPVHTPASSATPAPLASPPPSATPAVSAQVLESASQLNLRATPGTAGKIIAQLPALTALTLVGRTEPAAWFAVALADGRQGWVSADHIEITAGSAQALAVTAEAVDASVTGSFGSYLSGITSHSREIFVQGQALGNRDFAFSMVGDSNTDNPAFMLPFDAGQYDLGAFADLEPSLGYFSGSFSRDSAAALGGFNTSKVLDPLTADDRCVSGESPLACEYRLHQPSVALILLGTGDQHSWQGFEGRYRQIVEYTIARGIVPVLMTKADDLESRENTASRGFINAVIRRLAQEYDVPLLDLGAAVAGLPNHGCVADGFHFNSPPDGQTTKFDAEHLRYGFNVRNLTALLALDALRRYALYN